MAQVYGLSEATGSVCLSVRAHWIFYKLTLPLSGALSWASYEVGKWKAGHAGHCGQSILRSLWVGFLVSPDMLSRIHIPLLCVPATHHLLEVLFTLQNSGWGEKEMGFGSVSHSWEATGSLTCSHLTWWRSHWLRRALLALSCAALEGCVKWVKSDCSSYPFQCILSHASFALVVGWNFSMGLLDLHRGSHLWVIV